MYARNDMKHKYKCLQYSFYSRDTHDVAKDLLGKLLIRKWNKHELVGRITEVESYVGVNDAACHASRGRTARTEIMFGKAGRAYIYLVYGMHYCLNVVTERKDFPAAVLIRSLEPMVNTEKMMRARKVISTQDEKSLCSLTNGPGKLTQALLINGVLNGENLVNSKQLFIADDGYRVTPDDIATSPRIGVAYAGQDALLPWRYFLRHSPCVSKK